MARMELTLAVLSTAELIARLTLVKERALADAFSASQEFDVGPSEHEASARDYDDTKLVIDEVIRRLSENAASH